MSKILELLLTKKPKDAQANTKGIDKTPIGVEFPFQNSKDLMNKDLAKPRGGNLGNQTGGFNPTKKYADSVNTAKNK
jgi:hypothetical protein